MFDEFGNRMKEYEAAETARRLDTRLPVYARIDGRGFSKFTKGLARPFDMRMTRAMVETTKYLVNTTNAKIGYTQSDEISLVWWLDGTNALEQMFFDGKVQKLVSVLAGMATARFTREVLSSDADFAAYAEKLPHFDARVFTLPSLDEASNAFLWRAQDARRNAISMVAHDLFAHKELQGVGQQEMLRMIAEQGVAFDDFPRAFRHGTFLRRELREVPLTEAELAAIPQRHQPQPGRGVIRSVITEIDMPAFSEVTNRPSVVFYGADPETVADEADEGEMDLIAELAHEAALHASPFMPAPNPYPPGSDRAFVWDHAYRSAMANNWH
jgi:tRNA(His) guanylyltransferase